MLRMRLLCISMLVLGLTGVAICAPKSDDTAVAGQKIIAQHGSAVVTVQIAVKTTMSYGGQPPMSREQKNEASGLVIDPDGLVVMSLSMTSPEGMFGQMMPDESEQVSINSEITDLKIILGDGKEIAAKVVLRDKDRDLAFLRPTVQMEKALPAVDLSKSSKPAHLDQIIQLDRMGTIAGRVITGAVSRINAIVEKPRTFYIAQFQSFGSPIFAMDGSVVGLVLFRATTQAGESTNQHYIPIIMPAEDILEAAKQAPK